MDKKIKEEKEAIKLEEFKSKGQPKENLKEDLISKLESFDIDLNKKN